MFGNGSTSWRSPQSANGTQGPKSPELLARCQETGQSEITLTDQAASRMPPGPQKKGGAWASPRASDTTGAGEHGTGGQENPTLKGQAKLWTTPCADDTGTRKKPYSQGGSPLSLQVKMMRLDGVELLNLIQNSHPNSPLTGRKKPLRLNPRFEEWLMRWKIGWIGCGLSETESILWSRRWRSRLFGIDYTEDK